jgi:hypothetical protein
MSVDSKNNTRSFSSQFASHFVLDPNSPIQSNRYSVTSAAKDKLKKWTSEYLLHYTADPDTMLGRQPAEYRLLREAKLTMGRYASHYTTDPLAVVVTDPMHSVNSARKYQKRSLNDILDQPSMDLLNNVLAQKRQEEIFYGFVPSPMHQARMAKLPLELRIPRESWVDHGHWSLNKQMTAYHVPIRWKMQQVIAQLVACYHSNDAIAIDFGRSRPAMEEQLADANRVFSLCMMVLSGHVVKEEGGTFPSLGHFFPHVDMSDMYDTHRELEDADEKVKSLFVEVEQNISHDLVAKLIQEVVHFDALLNQHLGEEEELVVPMSLLAPDAMHKTWPFSPETVEQSFVQQYAHHFVIDPNVRVRLPIQSRSKL